MIGCCGWNAIAVLDTAIPISCEIWPAVDGDVDVAAPAVEPLK